MAGSFESGGDAGVVAAAMAIGQGKFVVVMDDESRENEGDLVMAAQFVTTQACAFMVANTNGLLCVPMTQARSEKLELPMMVSENKDRNETAFSITCDATVGTTTGASASDRALTTRLLSVDGTAATDLNRPGHILPLVARDGGVLVRGGHTEASVDLCLLAGCRPVALICELMHPDGTMMRRDGCIAFAQQHDLVMISVKQLEHYRREVQSSVSPAPAVHGAVVAAEAAVVQCAEDERFMRMAIAEAERGRLSAPPNPWVGCVLVAAGEVIGRGFHTQAGQSHAEVEALADAHARNPAAVAGCTAYVTLEPCHHLGRTGPCDAALIEARVARVVVCVEDPDPRVGGHGIEALRKAGIEVVVGVCGDEGRRSLRSYLTQRSTGRPHVVLKAALSLDGKVACEDGTSQWITGPEARADSHLLRAMSQAILVGSGTACADLPKLTVRALQLASDTLSPVAPLLRVVLDARGSVREGPLLDTAEAPTLIFTTKAAPADVVTAWTTAGVEVQTVSAAEVGGGVQLTEVLDELGRRGVLQLMVEGGGAVHTSFLKQNLADAMHLYKGATALGEGGRPWITAPLTQTISDARFWTLSSVRPLGNDVVMIYDSVGAGAPVIPSTL
eukprot:m.210750 g.210750  ORF g.210750 m.210750 type:complete len:618 (+) comp25494_c0_seq7:97-1950(+)